VHGMQEARRAPLVVFAAAALVTVLIDQLTKWWAVQSLQSHAPISLLGSLLQLEFLRNGGAAFGQGAGYTIVLTAIAVSVSVGIVVVARKLRDPIWALGLGLFLGGAVGNLIDRLFRHPGVGRGHVVDFIGYGQLFVGNLADLALTCAAVIVVVRSMQGVKLDGSR
jgi:signal peptidase II